ncbi:DUF6545 domain-containing protein [Nocardia amamiensis]|uniref:DUF6545 domain-containing protein n=1 Tax=Nocardia amamiensis TaxID=404578 RepID=UPI000830F7A7|nr:DUF6545 domain-containing protein [Nocardia amamiensis]
MWPQTLPTPVTVVATVFIVSFAIARIALVRRASEADHLINVIAGITAFGVLLREPAVARQVAGFVPGGLPTLFDVWHWTTVLTWTWGLGLWLLREYGPVRYKTRFRIAIGGAASLGVALILLSSPARAQGVSIAEYGGLRYGIYLGLLSTPAVFVSGYMLRNLPVLRLRATSPREANIVRILVVVAVLSVVPVSSLVLFAALGALGLGTDFTRHMYDFTSDGLASGEPQLLFAAVLTLVVVPSCARAAARLRQLTQLYPLWRDLTAAVPEVVFSLRWGDRWGATPAERVERLHIEIRDAAEIVARYARPLPAVIDELIESTITEDDQEHARLVTELVVAAQRLADSRKGESAGKPSAQAADVPDQDTLLRWWNPAKSLLQEAEFAFRAASRDVL